MAQLGKKTRCKFAWKPLNFAIGHGNTTHFQTHQRFHAAPERTGWCPLPSSQSAAKRMAINQWCHRFFFQMEDTSKSSHILHLFDGEANSFGPLDISERDQLIDWYNSSIQYLALLKYCIHLAKVIQHSPPRGKRRRSIDESSFDIDWQPKLATAF